MKSIVTTAEEFESTYALLVRFEEKERGIFEALVYLVFILSAVFSIWNMAQQSIGMPQDGAIRSTSVVESAENNRA